MTTTLGGVEPAPSLRPAPSVPSIPSVPSLSPSSAAPSSAPSPVSPGSPASADSPASPDFPDAAPSQGAPRATGRRARHTPLERAWIAYDIGNSAFTLLVSTLIPIWFHALAANAGMDEASYLAWWSYATGAATIATATLGPLLGTLCDTKGLRKPIFVAVLAVGVAGCAVMGVVPNWIAYLVTYLVAKVCYQISLVVYDSMLPDVTTPERMDDVSSQGYAWGYLGSCVPFVAALALYLLGSTAHVIPEAGAVAGAFLIVAVWWLGVTLPLLRRYRQAHYVEGTHGMVRASLCRLGATLAGMARRERKVLFFLIAFFLYIDGVYTIIDEAVAIGTTLGLDTTGLLVILLATQVVAFAFAALFGRLAARVRTETLLMVCIGGYLCVALYALVMHTLWQFGIMAFVVGVFQGAIQALSRSYYARIIPPERSGEYFGLYDICGKGAAFLGTMIIGVTVQATGSVNVAVATLGVLFAGGAVMLRLATRMPDDAGEGREAA